MVSVLVRKADSGLIMEEKATRKWRQRSECHRHKPANTWGHQNMKRQGINSSLEPSTGGRWQRDFQIYDLQRREIMDVCGFVVLCHGPQESNAGLMWTGAAEFSLITKHSVLGPMISQWTKDWKAIVILPACWELAFRKTQPRLAQSVFNHLSPSLMKPSAQHSQQQQTKDECGSLVTSQTEEGAFKGRDEQMGVARKMTLKGFVLLKVTLALIWIKAWSAILGLVGKGVLGWGGGTNCTGL